MTNTEKHWIYPSLIEPLSTEVRRRRPERHVMERNKSYALTGLAGGILCGFILCLWIKPFFLCTVEDCCLTQRLRAEMKNEISWDNKLHSPSINAVNKKQVLIGVMTAAKFIDNRALAVWQTWAKNINGDVIFFSGEESVSSHDIPLVALPGVTDVYPPQKKSFMMMKYLHDYGIDKYRYFMRVDDDVYVNGDKLDAFLNSLNYSQALYIGQAGTGKKEEVAELSLSPDENFCMGGPGVLVTGETLRRVIPHISYCLQHLLSTHEDIELGRCIRMFAGIPCTWNYEMQVLFYHSYTHATNSHVFPHDLTGSEMDRAITLHPIKVPSVMYHVHNEMLIRKKARLELQKIELKREIMEMDTLLDSPKEGLDKVQASMEQSDFDFLPWVFITSKSQIAHNMFNVKRNHERSWKQILDRALDLAVNQLNENAMSDGRLLDQPEIVYGYRRFHPLSGIQLKLNVKFRCLKFRGKSSKSYISKYIELGAHLSAPEVREVDLKSNAIVHLILPLSGKLKEFKRFLSQFEEVCKGKDSCVLLLVLYKSASYLETITSVSQSLLKHKIRILRVHGTFNRAVALHNGVMAVNDTELVMFVDVDIHLNVDALFRVKTNTRLRSQAYFPIVFNQYDSKLTCGANSCPVDNQTPEDGNFRFFGFGIASMYKADYVSSGGFDLNIRGWGKEDVDLYSKVLKTNTTVFRAADPGIVHIYHPKICDSTLNVEQTVMCVNSKAASFASQHKLAQLYFNSRHKSNLTL